LQNNFAAAGFSQAEIDEWLKAWGLFFDYVRKGEGSDRTQLDALTQRLSKNPKLTNDLRKSWLADLQTPVDWKGRNQEVFRYPPDFDPKPLWQHYTGPVLIIFGSMDSLAPVRQSLPAFADVLEKRQNSNSLIVLFPKANHTLLESTTRDDRGLSNLKKYVPGCFDLMTDWLKKRVLVKN
jgi:pimeloyl-ACP methyl ester carboxylesterase